MPTALRSTYTPWMSRYRRAKIEGGTFFFTVTLADRASELLVRHVDLLRAAYAFVQERYPFETVAICIRPDHVHAIWTLPDGDTNYSRRWSLIKSRFSRVLPAAATRSPSKMAKRDKGIWQAPLLGTRDPGRYRSRAPHRLHPFQSDQARISRARVRLAVQQLPSLRCERRPARGLGWRSRYSRWSVWRVETWASRYAPMPTLRSTNHFSSSSSPMWCCA